MGSCNGFLCLFRYNDKTDAFIFNISNPITHECIPLPVNEEIRSPLPDFGFGFSPISDVYKVVVFANNRKRKEYCRDLKVMVLTVGFEIWRRIGKIRDTVGTTKGVFHEGHLHWVCGCNGYRPHFIRAFDVESEHFKDLPMPPHYFNHSSIPELGVIGGSLSVSDGSTFWIMKEYGVKASWTKVLEIGYDTIDSIIGNLYKQC
ncbi:PREDICTED: F-box/kelch-repeat protein At3g06240-like [Fragaria vesca subsp. vesca]|uniref:F-box/kelch-repeat protein At3g06240-like n=1 Tax=Fragaria vesca subsp. vesca TaxID=101020 RepID=UPI0002C34477|nr:PREDICTED: F-box/kelch-repeat protein At3g06240-like [Fragaria vesca subsp. vesca]